MSGEDVIRCALQGRQRGLGEARSRMDHCVFKGLQCFMKLFIGAHLIPLTPKRLGDFGKGRPCELCQAWVHLAVNKLDDDEVIDLLIETFRPASQLVGYFELLQTRKTSQTEVMLSDFTDGPISSVTVHATKATKKWEAYLNA